MSTPDSSSIERAAMVTRILCAVDLSELSIRALAYAGEIARWYRSELTALHVVPAFEPAEVPPGRLFDPLVSVYPMTGDEIGDELRRAAQSAGVSDRVCVAARSGDPSRVIVEQAAAARADLLVLATHGRSGWNRLVLGSVAETVLRTAPCPVFTVPPHAPKMPSGVAVGTVLCAVDFSPASLHAAAFAADVARRAAATLTLLEVVEWLAEEEPRAIAHFSVPEARASLMIDELARLDRLVAEQPPAGRGAATRVAAGRAYRQILHAASEIGADLIVMGAQGRGGTPLVSLGSTTHQVVRGATCPVLTVPVPAAAAVASHTTPDRSPGGHHVE